MKRAGFTTRLILAFTLSALPFTESWAQATNLDTLAIQDFELNPSPMNWSYNVMTIDSPAFSSGFSASSNCSPVNSPLGIGGSRAWNTTQVSSGTTIRMDNIPIPNGIYDSIRFVFRLAAFNLVGSTGGPDNLDFVAVKYSIDNGATFVPRLRIRGAVANNSTWGYDASGVAQVNYLPSSVEPLFAPTNSGLQTSEGYSYCEITFPGNIQNASFEITARSSSSSDTWLIDNILLTGENNCLPDITNVNASACNQYTSPAGNIYSTSGTYNDTLQNIAGCDSIVITNLVITAVNATITIGSDNLTCNQSNATYQWLDCSNGLQPIAGETGQTFIPTTGGSYAVAVQYQGCTDTSVCLTVSFTGFDEHQSIQWEVYPNPASDWLNLRTTNASKGHRFQMLSICGQLMFEDIIAWESVRIDLKHLPDGVYLMKLHGSKPRKLVIQR